MSTYNVYCDSLAKYLPYVGFYINLSINLLTFADWLCCGLILFLVQKFLKPVSKFQISFIFFKSVLFFKTSLIFFKILFSLLKSKYYHVV